MKMPVSRKVTYGLMSPDFTLRVWRFIFYSMYYPFFAKIVKNGNETKT